MRILAKLLWRMLTRLLHQLGPGVLLVPVAALSMVLFGVSVWTLAAVVLASILAFRMPAAAAALLPVTMVGLGIGGLVAAAANPRGPVTWVVRRFISRQQPAASSVPHRASHISSRPARQAVWQVVGATRPPHLPQLYLPPKTAFLPAGGAGQIRVGAAGPFTHGPGLWQGRLAVPVALVLLTLGLWLAPRTLAGVRARVAVLAPDLRAWVRENRWGALLVPVAMIGLPVFGVHPWTVAAVLAALLVAVRWPAIAADLVPVALVVFAVHGFRIAASWRSLPAGVNSPTVLAGVEASAFLAFAAWLVPRTIGAHLRAWLAPGPDPDLAGRLQRLTETRGHAVDAAASELRRIERDLHDGAQARLVALGMNLRAVERLLPASPQAALGLVAEARETSLRALNDLRDLVRGICPPVLADRGLGHAVQALALDTPLPAELDIDLPGRLTAPVESACYFAVAEALANAVKHSGARRVHIRIQHRAGILRIEVADDGAGGADPARGTGLQGVERRLGTFDGILAVSSPPGGPTMIVMEVPCVLPPPEARPAEGQASRRWTGHRRLTQGG
jgi:signal transduction histidine kinase